MSQNNTTDYSTNLLNQLAAAEAKFKAAREAALIESVKRFQQIQASALKARK